MSLRRASRTSPASNAPAPADPQALRAAAVALLARRDYASGALCERLAARGFGVAATAAVVAELQREGIVNDARYAQNYVAYHAGRGEGPLRIATELRRKGVPGGLIEAALAEGPDWGALARQVRSARFGGPPASWTEKARQARFLQYRGFSSDHIRAATGAEVDLD
jgi:regulatory protein